MAIGYTGIRLLVEVAELRKLRGERTILGGVSFSVPRGQTLVIMGPSGSGKTTLLRCMNGLERADGGLIRIGDLELQAERVNPERILLAIRRRVGLVFQQWHLFADRTVLDNVIEAPIHVAGLSRPEAKASARVLLERVGIADRAAAYPHQLSGGEQQRTAIARALAMRPDVLLLDEPTSALDGGRAADVLALLRDLAADGLTLIVASHDARVPEILGGQLLNLQDGRITHGRQPAPNTDHAT